MTKDARVDDRSVIARSSSQISADVDGQTVVMGMSQGKYVGFDKVASAVWRHLEEPCTVTALCANLAEEFDGPPERIRLDTIGLLNQLNELGLIDIRSDGTAS